MKKHPYFLHADTNSLKLKVHRKKLGWAGHKWCAHSGFRNLKLAVSQKEINGINWLLLVF